MKGIILAGGTGSRLRPLTNVTNKHLLPIYDKPMIFYPLEFLKSMGIKEIILTTGKEFAGDFADLLGDGSAFGVSLTYKVQESPLGIAHALGVTESIIGEDSIMVILGDNVFMLEKEEEARMRERAAAFASNPDGAVIFLKEVDDPRRFGVPTIGNGGKLLGITEKPTHPGSNYAVTGLYLYDSNVFRKIKALRPSSRGELELTDVNNAYLTEGKLDYSVILGEWTDAGTFESLHKANLIAKEARHNGK